MELLSIEISSGKRRAYTQLNVRLGDLNLQKDEIVSRIKRMTFLLLFGVSFVVITVFRGEVLTSFYLENALLRVLLVLLFSFVGAFVLFVLCEDAFGTLLKNKTLRELDANIKEILREKKKIELESIGQFLWEALGGENLQKRQKAEDLVELVHKRVKLTFI